MIVFLGDSITQWWDTEYFNHFFSVFNPVNMGIIGHTTKNTIELLNSTKLQTMQADIVILMIGTNNSEHYTTIETVKDIQIILRKITEIWPKSKIILVGPLPRGERRSDPKRVYNNEVNKLLSKETFTTNVFYINIGYMFINDEGRINRHIMYDGLHLTRLGYKILSNSLSGFLFILLGISPS